MIAKPLVAASLAVLSWSALLPVASAAQPIVQVAPPPPRVEVVPAPRHGMVWSPGHWEWRHQRHVWVEGHWVKARPGYVYAQPEWRQANGRFGSVEELTEVQGIGEKTLERLRPHVRV